MTQQSASLSRQTRRFETRREAIHNAAVRLFNQKGIRGATFSDVARSVGLMTHSVTYYYRKKEELAAACFLRAIDTVDGLVVRAAAAPTAQARIREFVRNYFRLLAEIAAGRHPEVLVFSEIRALKSPNADPVFAAYTDLFRRVRGLLPGGVQSPLGRTEQNARAHLLLSLTLWGRFWVERCEPDDYDRAADRLFDILIGGLASPSATWAPSPLPDIDGLRATGAEVSREAFLGAATRLVNEQGYRGASVDKISARVNVTKGSFYHHNDNKDDLIADCFKRSFAVIRHIQDLAALRASTGWDRLSSASVALVRYQLAPQGPLLRATACSALPEALRHDMLAGMNRLTERFAAFIVDGLIDGSIRPLDPSIAAQMVQGMINAAAELAWWVPGVTVHNAAELYARPLFTGLLCPPP